MGAGPPSTWQRPQRSRNTGKTSVLYLYFDVMVWCASIGSPEGTTIAAAAAAAMTIHHAFARINRLTLRSGVAIGGCDVGDGGREQIIRIRQALSIPEIPIGVEAPRGNQQPADRRSDLTLVRVVLALFLERERHVLAFHGRQKNEAGLAAVDEHLSGRP